MGALPKKKGKSVKGGKGGRRPNPSEHDPSQGWSQSDDPSAQYREPEDDSEDDSEDNSEDDSEDDGEEAPFPHLEHACSLCGAELTDGKQWKACGACGITRYCSADCQREAWKRPVGHKASCGARLPTPGRVSRASPEALPALLAQWCRADLELAGLALARVAALAQRASAKRALVRSGVASACIAAGSNKPAAVPEARALARCRPLSAREEPSPRVPQRRRRRDGACPSADLARAFHRAPCTGARMPSPCCASARHA